jgi:hypothetical protein
MLGKGFAGSEQTGVDRKYVPALVYLGSTCGGLTSRFDWQGEAALP